MAAESNLLYPLKTSALIPESFPSPFSIDVCELAADAADSLKSRLAHLCSGLHDFAKPEGGKMMGVLVVQTANNKIAYLSAFSGMLGKRWDSAGFVPPVFDVSHRNSFLDRGESTLKRLNAAINDIDQNEQYQCCLKNRSAVQDHCSQALADSNRVNRQRRQSRSLLREQQKDDIDTENTLLAESREDKRLHRELKQQWQKRIAACNEEVEPYENQRQTLIDQRRQLSHQLQLKVFEGYLIKSSAGELTTLSQLFGEKTPPGGAGDCAAVKLFSTCFEHQLRPLCLAEFWWGSSPVSGIRRHGNFYPSCRGKCGVILPFMLQGIATGKATHEILAEFPADQPHVIYEDDALIVIDKPAGMLSVPGKIATDSVESRLRAVHPQTSNANLLVHRLDQATSGVMVAAKTSAAHKHLQLQFQQRQIEKQYCAILSGSIHHQEGCIDLPLRVDIDDRPRQLVCNEHGKNAVTHYRVIESHANTTRVVFKPITGRTHQLRVHAAHQLGLHAAIVGDELYGKAADRMYLHAESIGFVHPQTGRRMDLTVPSPF